MNLRIPYEEAYVSLLGQAVYFFGYYEKLIVECVDYLNDGFAAACSRDSAFTAGSVAKRFREEIAKLVDSAKKESLKGLSKEFDGLVAKRNALIHARPITDSEGAQTFAYQGKVTTPFADFWWSTDKLREVIEDFDAASCRAADVLEQLRSGIL